MHHRRSSDRSSSQQKHRQLMRRDKIFIYLFDVHSVHLDHASPRYGGMYCRDQESLNWLAQCTWLMAADQYLIVLAISCIGSFRHRGETHIARRRVAGEASSPCGLPCGMPWTERPDRSTPSAPVLQRVRVERRQLYLGVRHHLADNSFREVGSRRWTVRMIIGPAFCTRTFTVGPALY